MQTEISRFDLVNQVCQAARSDPNTTWEQMREDRISQAQAEMGRIESRISRKRRDFSKPNAEETARAEARAKERQVRAEARAKERQVRAEARAKERQVRAEASTSQTTPTERREKRYRKTLYAWGNTPKH